MTEAEILTEITRQIRTLMPDVALNISPDTAFEELGMDSLTRVDLLSAAELAFDIEVPDDQVATLVRLRDLVEFVRFSRAAA